MAVRKLRIQEPDKSPREIDLASGMTIGRAATNRCVLDDAAASGEHARIVEIGGALAIQDVGSANKTRIEGGPALAKDQHARLEPGMRFTIGGTRLEVIGEADDDAGATMQRPKAERSEDATDMKTLARPRAAAPAPAVARPAPLPATAPIAAPRAAPAPAPKQAPLVPATSPGPGEDLGPENVDVTAAVGSPEFEPALMRATLSEAKPRLVFRARKQGVVAPITEASQILGRRKGGDVAIGLDDDGVSSKHARLTLSGRTFWIEDLESKNHTHLDKEQLAPKVKRALHGDCWLRFGTVDVLFVTENVAGMESPSPAMQDAAIEYLAESGALAGESLKRARTLRKEGKHPAEELISAGTISVPQWHEAVTTAKLRVRATVPKRGGSKQTLIIGGLVVLVVVLIVVVILLKSGK
jgi:pSer/pThr/pTyr-binding forkhead associated (FHA) protein